MNEAYVTLSLRKYFIDNDWDILTFDYPQSGTGFIIQPNYTNEKNKNSIIPDLVVRKDNKGIFLENKDRFYLNDFNKINEIRTFNDYSLGISSLFDGSIPKFMWYGIGIPDNTKDKQRAFEHLHLIDILFTVKPNSEISIPFSKPKFVQ